MSEAEQTARVTQDAEVAALYLRTLISNGVSVLAAVQLTGSYLASREIGRRSGEPPKEPWQGGGS